MPQLIEMRERSNFSDPEALCIQEERYELLWEAINQLETKSKLAVCQLGLEENETREIIRETRLSRSGVRSRLQRALRRLRTMLADKLSCGGEQIQHLA
jgi:DNA-directed RNA polymerase specialized sigma24 family protein